MTFSLARALGPEIRLNIVAPGYVRTPWHIAAHGAEGAADLERRFAERAPLKAAAEPQDVADAIIWLIEGARRVTGEIIYVDAGMHIASPR
jgi:3-oxoacyl-[acyl-carrier protein] reductase